MKKRIISLISAAAMVLSMTAVTANAAPCQYLTDRELNDTEYMANLAMALRGAEVKADTAGCKNGLVATYLSEKGWGMVEIYDAGTAFTMKFSSDAHMDSVKTALAELAPDAEIAVSWERPYKAPENEVYPFTVNVTDPTNSPQTAALAKALCSKFKAEYDLTGAEYLGHLYKLVECAAPGKAGTDGKFAHHVTYSADDVKDILDDAAAYLDETGAQAELVPFGGDYIIAPETAMTLNEQFAIARELYEKFGLSYKSTPLEGTAPFFEVETADVLNSIDGDANCDNELSIADATAIMQAIGDPDEYALSMQGSFNADIYATGDGVTGMDALEVMKKCLVRK